MISLKEHYSRVCRIIMKEEDSKSRLCGLYYFVLLFECCSWSILLSSSSKVGYDAEEKPGLDRNLTLFSVLESHPETMLRQEHKSFIKKKNKINLM